MNVLTKGKFKRKGTLKYVPGRRRSLRVAAVCGGMWLNRSKYHVENFYKHQFPGSFARTFCKLHNIQVFMNAR